MTFKMTPELGKQTIDELTKLSSLDLVTIGKKKCPKGFPPNFFSFIQYRAGTILETRGDRWVARRQYDSAKLDREMKRTLRQFINVLPSKDRAFFLNEFERLWNV